MIQIKKDQLFGVIGPFSIDLLGFEVTRLVSYVNYCLLIPKLYKLPVVNPLGSGEINIVIILTRRWKTINKIKESHLISNE